MSPAKVKLNKEAKEVLQGFYTFLDVLQDTQEASGKSEQIREIVPIREWLADHKFLGPEAGAIYDFWIPHIIDFFENDYIELILTGALGGGKSYCALIVALRKIYELSCYRNIPLLFGLSPSSTLLFMYLSVSREQAKRTGYGKFKKIVDASPYFLKYFPRDMLKDMEIEFTQENILFAQGSTPSHFIGTDLYGLIFDESNFVRGGKGDYGKFVTATEIYRESTNRRQSRFLESGYDEGFSIIVSSSDTQTSFTEQRIEEAKSNPTTKVVHVTLPQVHPERYSKTKFYVFKGNDMVDPFVYDAEHNDEVDNFNKASGNISYNYQKPPENVISGFAEIPIDFKRAFTIDLIGSLKEVAGVPVMKFGKLFYSNKNWRRIVNSTKQKHPFSKEGFVISTGDSVKVSDFWLPGLLVPVDYCNYVIHIDQSTKSDKTGMAMSHLVPLNDGTGDFMIYVDFILQIIPPKKPEEVDIAKCRDFIYFLIKQGFNIRSVSYDIYASQESMQNLNKQDIRAFKLSVDTDDSQYRQTKFLINADRVRFYDHSVFKKEFFDVDHNRERKRVDHPPGSSKDVSDAVVGSIWSSILYSLAEDTGTYASIRLDVIKAMTDKYASNKMSRFNMISDETHQFKPSMIKLKYNKLLKKYVPNV